LKHDEHGDVVKHKARLVAKGYVQRQGIDFDEVFTPVARMKSVRVMIILAAHLSWSVHHMDVKSAFLMVIWERRFMSRNLRVHYKRPRAEGV
jgi:hypothetical protein